VSAKEKCFARPKLTLTSRGCNKKYKKQNQSNKQKYFKKFTESRAILWKKDSIHMTKKLECGPMPNVMAALPNIGGALYSTP